MSLFFLEHGLNDTQIGILLSISPLVSTFSAPVLGFAADKAASKELRIPKTVLVGHAAALAVFVCATTFSFFCFLFLASPNTSFGAFVLVQCAYSFSISAVFGCLDGLSIRFLAANGGGTVGYGSERLYGAYGWAVSSLILGAASDVWGLVRCSYICVALTSLTVLFTLVLFSNGLAGASAIVDPDAQPNEIYSAVHQPAHQYHEKEGEHKSEHKKGGSDALTSSEEISANVSAASSLWLMMGNLVGTPSRFGFMFCCVTMAAATSIVEKLVFLFFAQDLGASYLVCVAFLFSSRCCLRSPSSLMRHRC